MLIKEFFGMEARNQLCLRMYGPRYYIHGGHSGDENKYIGNDHGIVTHEMTHWYRGNLYVHNQLWFDEGMANYLEGFIWKKKENPDPGAYSFADLYKDGPQWEWYQGLKNGENLFEEEILYKDKVLHKGVLKNAHDVGIMFFIGLETDYEFDYNNIRDMTRAMTKKRFDEEKCLNADDIKKAAEQVGGVSLDNLYKILGPGIKHNGYY